MATRTLHPQFLPKPTHWLARRPQPRIPRRVQPQPQTQARSNSNTPPKPGDTPPSTARADRLISRLPRFFQKYAHRLRSAPLSHVISFGILHELTAVVPLLGLFGLFHYTNYVPLDWAVGMYGGWAVEAAVRFERYFSRKGWFGFRKGDGEGAGDAVKEKRSAHDFIMEKWRSSDSRYKIIVEIALAYAITKALLPVRIAVSLWATPWFAGILVRAQRVFRRSK